MTLLQETLRVAAGILGDRARRHAPLGPLTTYGVGGTAALLLEQCGPDDLVLARRAVAASGVPVLVLGRGSNVLVSDRGFPGLVLTLGDAFAAIHVDAVGGDAVHGNAVHGNAAPAPAGPGERVLVRAGGAVSFPVLARRTAALGLRGLEWAVGVPGTVGGAVRMNAGGHGSDVAASLVRAWVFDLGADRASIAAGDRANIAAGDRANMEAGDRAVESPAADLALGYRRSNLGPLQIVVAAEFSLTAGDRTEAEAEIAGVVRWRREHQPGGANAGSVFANPEGDSAGRLIDAAGLRGHRRGSAYVSPKHANFVQVDPGGSADDVRDLIDEVRKTVKDTLGVELTLENRLVGFEPLPSSGG